MRHINLRAALTLASLLLLPGCSSSPAGPSPAPPPVATRDGRFIQDIDALALDLPRLHANLFFKTTREEFDREVASLKTRVAEMADHEVVTGLMRLAALPGDNGAFAGMHEASAWLCAASVAGARLQARAAQPDTSITPRWLGALGLHRIAPAHPAETPWPG